MSLAKYHELESATDGLVYFTPAKGPDPLGSAIRKNGGARAEAELQMVRLRVGEAVVRRGYGTKSAYIVVTGAPASKDGLEAYTMAIRVCLDAAEKYNLTSLTFGSWSLSSAGLPAIVAAKTIYQVIDEWREANKRRVLKKIVLALHDEVGYEAFKLVNGLSARQRAELSSDDDAVWKVPV